MNIIEAKKLANEGKSLVGPDGYIWTVENFQSAEVWPNGFVFGEWRLNIVKPKSWPVVFESFVERISGLGNNSVHHSELNQFKIATKVRVTVEVIDEPS
jgi:hypothetical protein